mmetsp:Transcript_28269/g.83725  ORF Transcript_28269/g.83725 Transcript_28269/m.83725 type:complete len:213 (+) Transcript_28269:1765-2403(+)|eukprot:353270-Chlamydomonas_euryale.AAC.2
MVRLSYVPTAMIVIMLESKRNATHNLSLLAVLLAAACESCHGGDPLSNASSIATMRPNATLTSESNHQAAIGRTACLRVSQLRCQYQSQPLCVGLILRVNVDDTDPATPAGGGGFHGAAGCSCAPAKRRSCTSTASGDTLQRLVCDAQLAAIDPHTQYAGGGKVQEQLPVCHFVAVGRTERSDAGASDHRKRAVRQLGAAGKRFAVHQAVGP